MARVSIENVSKIFDGNVVAVDNASIDIADKEFVVIVGPSGCGKTTILRMVAGLEEIGSGQIKIGDTVVNNMPPKDRDIAMVFQNYALYPHMTVFQNIAFGLKLRKIPKEEIKGLVNQAATMLGIEQLLHRKPKALSGGQQQRVALGRAIVRKPAAFLFDEPLSNLDAKLRVTTRTELKALHQRLQTTSVYVTHDQAEAMTLGDRICVLYNGVVQQVAPPMEVYNKPVNRFVAGFLGTPPMNFLDGRIILKDNKTYFTSPDASLLLAAINSQRLSAYNNKNVILGIRPEALSVNPVEDQQENQLAATVSVVEPLGDRIEAYLETKSGHRFTVNLDAHIRMAPAQAIQIHIDMKKVHLFEPGETGRNILLN